MSETQLKRLAQRIVRKVLDHNLLERGGFRYEWHRLPQKDKEEIRKTMVVDVLVCLGTIEGEEDNEQS